MNCAIYARVSTVDQNCEIQLAGLRGFASRSGWSVGAEYVEKVSGKAGAKRPELERLLKDARLRKFDVVVVWKMDRFGRSTLDTLENIRTLDHAGVRFLCPEQGIDTDQRNPIARFTITILSAVAELERSFINERTSAGLKAYRELYQAGKIGEDRHSKSGKDLPVGGQRRIFDREKVLQLRAEGKSVRVIAKTMGLSVGTVFSVLSEGVQRTAKAAVSGAR